MARVTRTLHELGKYEGLATLRQRFHFEGNLVTAARIRDILLTAPLIGKDSVFGDRPGQEGPAPTSRMLIGFSPAPGFRFDVNLEERNGGLFVVRFSQPDLRIQYLQGDFVWTLTDERDGADLAEEINTEAALSIVRQPLKGDKPSLRRWLFFRVGHRQVMSAATANIAGILN